MKINALLALFAAASLQAAPLTTATAVHTKPDAASPSIVTLKPGTEPKAAVGIALPLPSGWSAVELEGPHDAYIQNKDIQKNLDIRPGSSFYASPKTSATVLTTMQEGDEFEITGYHGRWTQVSLKKKIVGYVHGVSGLGSGSPASSAVANNQPSSGGNQTPGGSASAGTAKPAPFSPAPVAPAAVTSGPGRPVQSVNLGDGGSASLPRLFQGKFVSSRSVLRPRRPYDFQLNDSAGQRYAYLDTTRLLQTEQIEKYVDRVVAVYGTAKPVPGTQDIVIEVESLQLK